METSRTNFHFMILSDGEIPMFRVTSLYCWTDRSLSWRIIRPMHGEMKDQGLESLRQEHVSRNFISLSCSSRHESMLWPKEARRNENR